MKEYAVIIYCRERYDWDEVPGGDYFDDIEEAKQCARNSESHRWPGEYRADVINLAGELVYRHEWTVKKEEEE